MREREEESARRLFRARLEAQDRSPEAPVPQQAEPAGVCGDVPSELAAALGAEVEGHGETSLSQGGVEGLLETGGGGGGEGAVNHSQDVPPFHTGADKRPGPAAVGAAGCESERKVPRVRGGTEAFTALASRTTPAWQVAVEATGSISTILFMAERESTTSSKTGTLPPGRERAGA